MQKLKQIWQKIQSKLQSDTQLVSSVPDLHAHTEQIKLAAAHRTSESGLDLEAVKQRLSLGQWNNQKQKNVKTSREIVRNNLFNLFNILNFILAVLVVIAAFSNIKYLNNILFMGVVVCNLTIGIYQELKAKKILDSLAILVSPKVKVKREGQIVQIPSEHIVIDDLVFIESGQQIPIDAVVLENHNLEVDESLLTGEADAVLKEVGAPVYAGSLVVAGSAMVQACLVGQATLANQIAQAAKTVKQEKSELRLAIKRIIQIISLVIIPVGLLLFWRGLHNSSDVPRVLVSTVAALIGMIPEGLVLLTEIAFAVATMNLAQNKTLVQRMSAIEMLARTDVLCLDKTGTITSGKMTVRALKLWQPNGFEAASEYDKQVSDYSGLIAEMLAATNNSGLTHEALVAEFMKERQADLAKQLGAVVRTINFSSARKWFGVEFKQAGTYLLGAAEFIYRQQNLPKALQEAISYYSNLGQRVLLLAHSQLSFAGETAPQELEPLALILIEDEIRNDAKETFNYFRKQGVKLKIISGDNPKTVAAIAKRAGFKQWQSYVDMSTIEDTANYAELVEKYSLFGRVNPYQKQALLMALQKNGHTVAMTGDGVNDVPALKKADCAIAMAAGSDATRKAADLVLMQNNLAALIAAVYEGRRVINNIELVATLFLSKTIYSCLLSLLFIFLPSQFPLYPIQITLISSLTIGIPAFFLALKPNRKRVTGHFLQKVMQKALPSGILVIILVLLIECLTNWFNLSYPEQSTLTVIVIQVLGFALLYKVAQPLTTMRYLLLLSLITSFFVCILFFPHTFFLTSLFSPIALLVLPLVALAGILFKLMLDWTPYLDEKIRSFLRNKRQSS